MNWKKMMAVGLAAVSMMAFVTGCGGDTKKANTELPKKVVIGLDDSFPPMGFKDEKGEIVGFDIDMAKEAAKRAGMDVEFKAIDWSSKEAELKSKKIDGTIVSAASVKPLDEKYILDNLDKYDNIFVMEEAYEKNSFGSSILDFINKRGKEKIINKIAIENGIVPHGKRGELLEEFGLKGENLIKRIEEKIDAGKK